VPQGLGFAHTSALLRVYSQFFKGFNALPQATRFSTLTLPQGKARIPEQHFSEEENDVVFISMRK
jgi:hypothetical protein